MEVIPRRLKTVDELDAIVGLLTTKDLYLFNNDIVPDPDAGLVQFTQPSGAWYSSPALTMGAAYIGLAGIAEAVSTLLPFLVAVAGPSETIYGCYIANTTTPTDWDYAARFDTPINMTAPPNGFNLVFRMSQPPQLGPIVF